MLKAGDVVVVNFVGAKITKPRPAVVLSSDEYHRQRPDVILGVLTTDIAASTATTDHILQDWRGAGLRVPSAFRSYVGTQLQTSARRIGRLSDADWKSVQECVRRAIG